jgi:hypothetical protein
MNLPVKKLNLCPKISWRAGVVNLSDEILMAYADGHLDARERSRVDAHLMSNPEGRKRLEVFTTTGASLGLLFQKPMNEPVPAHLVEFLLRHNAAPRVKPLSYWRKSRNLLDMLRTALHSPASSWHMAFASGAMLVIGASVGWLSHANFGNSSPLQGAASSSEARNLVAFNDGQFLADGAFQQALETTPSGKEVALNSAVKMKVTLTFKSREKTYCREYEILTNSAADYAGLGCRDQKGKWSLQVNAASAHRNAQSNQTIPAGSESLGALEATVNDLMEGDALGRNEELTAIGNNWQK